MIVIKEEIKLRMDEDGTVRLRIADFLLDEHSLSISAA
jgi:hypothetical protein